ncbi:uncharacterized protein GGS22DRAFT_197060 [Annulohypoxylon maeteangense]|uniref:uncharacterized protein n=1 Tax=Annulohypoxylon maeteangense TaxID=1927788 RepID=UPI0020083ADE|nr:uncharacterized protein GGS22DRAFT_197060 [Annulohypoxylon maeteangense]KAI0881335.1 hypothetical protein GGS22DRAFT_197060 [Annulohypoxylon maeteangense]
MRVSTIAAAATLFASAFSMPAPQEGGPDETDLCLQRKFLSASLCTDLDTTYTNATLPSLGWYCCWYQGPFLPPPAQATSAWITFAADGSVANRCLTSGTCTAGLPDGKS